MDSQTTATEPTALNPRQGDSSPAAAPHLGVPPSRADPDAHQAPACEHSILLDASEGQRVAESFDRIFTAHNRLEQIHLSFDELGRIALTSRTVAGFIEAATRHLESSLDLVSVKILLAHDAGISGILRRDVPYGGGIISQDVRDISGDSLFFLGPESPELQEFFGDATGIVSSAAISTLVDSERPFGILSLGSGDPQRYVDVGNTMLIQALADTIALGLLNALDHERASREWLTETRNLYNEPFFREYLQKEFNRSLRSGKAFSVMAVSWRDDDDNAFSNEELMDLFRRNLRAGDVAAKGESIGLWLLLPETDSALGRQVAERLLSLCKVVFPETAVNIGIAEFSRSVATSSLLFDQARAALEQAVMENIPFAT